MMISPAGYVENELKGKPAEKVLSKIRGLQREMSAIRNKVESGQDFEELFICPSPQVQIDMIREYIEAAKRYYAELGGAYLPSKKEQKVENFDSNVDNICEITVEYGGFFGGTERRTLQGMVTVFPSAGYSIMVWETMAGHYMKI